jgi:hypothetical protein
LLAENFLPIDEPPCDVRLSTVIASALSFLYSRISSASSRAFKELVFVGDICWRVE